MGGFVIESGVPIPRKKNPGRRLSPLIELICSMECDQSIFLAAFTPKRANAVCFLAGRRGGKFSYRKVDGGARIWRVA